MFTKDSFELRQVSNKYLGLEEDKALIPKQRKNFVAGTDNKWKYKSFVNWDFFPSIDLPILVYFKETQTPKVRLVNWMLLLLSKIILETSTLSILQ